MSKALQIKGFPEYYITDTGEVFSRMCDKYHNKSCRIRKITPFKTRNNYMVATLRKDGRQIRKLVHRLVAETFIKNPENKYEVNHIDGNTLNNNVDNLEFCTKSENELHKFRILNKGHYVGKDNWNSKKVLQLKDGQIVAEYGSIRDAERATGINNTNISACCNKKYGYKTAGGYIWRYATLE